jgi:hypothetical protein
MMDFFQEKSMQRRQFISASVAGSVVALSDGAFAEAPAAKPREYYLHRRYFLQSGPQLKLTEAYISDVLIPALARMGMGPVGAFKVDFGPDTPAYSVLIPSTSLEMLATLDLRLAQDDAFMKIAEPFWSAPAVAPAFLRSESSLLAAFQGWPRVTPPESAATRGRRIFQLRTYQSPSNRDHVRKVEMFHDGEIPIFLNAGFHPVFFGDTLVGAQLPNLTYMLSFPDMKVLNDQWDVFRNDPAWKKMSASPRYGFEAIVSNITNVLLSPLSSSQI